MRLAKWLVGLATVTLIVAVSPRALAQELGWDQARARVEAAAQPYKAQGGVVIDAINGNASDWFMAPNSGAEAVLIIGSSDACRALRISVESLEGARASGQSERNDPHLLVLVIPPQLRQSLSNWRVNLSGRRSDECNLHWAVIATSPLPSFVDRGLPPPPTDAEWEAAAASGGAQISWSTVPTLEQLQFFYPPGALARDQRGAARLECLTLEGGRLRCRPWWESTANRGFADAAMRLASIVRVAATDGAGRSTVGRRAIFPIRFELMD